MTTDVDLQWVAAPAALSPSLLEDLVGCWSRVSDAGGAVGFPFSPVDRNEVRAAAERLRDDLDLNHRLLVGTVNDDIAGWLLLQLNASPLTRHWASISRVQTDLPWRGVGVGAALMNEVVRTATTEGLEQLHIDVRGGQGLEGFYARLGWTVVGRWPSALRLGPNDDRDEVLMVLHLDHG